MFAAINRKQEEEIVKLKKRIEALQQRPPFSVTQIKSDDKKVSLYFSVL